MQCDGDDGARPVLVEREHDRIRRHIRISGVATARPGPDQRFGALRVETFPVRAGGEPRKRERAGREDREDRAYGSLYRKPRRWSEQTIAGLIRLPARPDSTPRRECVAPA